MSYWNGISRIARSSGNITDPGICSPSRRSIPRKGVVWLSVNSSAPGEQGNYPAEKLNQIAAATVPHEPRCCWIRTGKVGHLYGAKTTPDMYIIDPNGTLVYKGAIDDKRSTDLADVKIATNYVEGALDAVDGWQNGSDDRNPTLRLQRKIFLKIRQEIQAENCPPRNLPRNFQTPLTFAWPSLCARVRRCSY